MSIDRIGKPPVPPLGTPTPGAGASGRASGESFGVSEAKADEAAGQTNISPLDKLRSGEISMDEYLQIRVDDATSHLQGKLSPGDLEFVQQSLREQIQTDPVLIELVRRASGGTPSTE